MLYPDLLQAVGSYNKLLIVTGISSTKNTELLVWQLEAYYHSEFL